MKRRTIKPAARRTPDDPVVKEVRAVRAKLLKKGGGTVAGYFRAMDELGVQRAARGKPAPARRSA